MGRGLVWTSIVKTSSPLPGPVPFDRAKALSLRAAGLLAVMLIALALMACGDDDDGGGDQATNGATDAPVGQARNATEREVEYFEALSLVIAEGNTGIAALAEERAVAFDPAKSETETQEALATLSLNAIDVYATRRDGILNVQPQPSGELQSLHLTLGGAADDELTIAENLAVALGEEPVDNQAAYEALLIELGANTGEVRFQDACMLLQTEADRLNADVDLHCVGAETTT